MSGDIDQYDVERIVQDRTRYLATDRDLNQETADRRNADDDLRRSIDDLRDEIRSLQRTLDSRTAHLG